jgi:hypothetical protein
LSLIGKGYFIWQVWNCERGDAQAIAARAKQAGLTHLLIKIADGTRSYNVDATRGVDLVPPVLRACKEAGIEVWGWHYVRGDNPIGEAQFAIQRSRQLGIDGYVIDAEAEYQTLGKTSAATRFMRELRAGLPKLPIALSSYRFPDRHRQLPWSAFLEACDYSMPQVYYEDAHNPTQQLEMSVNQYMALRPARPVIPTAPAYGRGSWRPTAQELVLFLAKAKELGLTAANIWSWDIASRPAYQDLWQAIAQFDWPVAPPPPPPELDVPERLFERFNEGDPGGVARLYHENAAHVTGERTIFSRDAIAFWYDELLTRLLPQAEFSLTGKIESATSRHFTWTAQSEAGQVVDGNDTIGLREGKIQFHYTYFNIH